MKKKSGVKTLLLILFLCFCAYCAYTDDDTDDAASPKTADSKDTLTAEDTVEEAPKYDILSVLFHCPYLDASGISIHHQSDRNKMPDKIADAVKKTPVSVYLADGGFFGKDYYAVTPHTGSVCYYGKVKDNRPDGFGVLANGELDLNNPDTIKNVVYAGNFSEGLYEGYGALFNSETQQPGQSYIGQNMVQQGLLNPDYEQLANLYYYNYVTYDGDWKDGEKSGKGNFFAIYNVDWNPKQTGYWAVILYPDTIRVAEFKNDFANGSAKIYRYGALDYDGELKNNAPSGKGTAYYSNGQKCYEGEWKNGRYNGKGKLYDEDGKLIYNGKWKDGDYAS